MKTPNVIRNKVLIYCKLICLVQSIHGMLITAQTVVKFKRHGKMFYSQADLF